MAENEKREEEQEKRIYIEEAEGQETAGYRLATPMHEVNLYRGDGYHQDQQYGDKDAFPAALSLFRLGQGFKVG
jgi:hypothetical protein